MTNKVYLASDNWAPAHPAIMQAIIAANEGCAPAYGADRWTEEAQALIQGVFRSPCRVFLVPTGTGANVFALALSCRRHESVVCTDIAHLQYQESGAAEALVGCKLLPVPHREGKVTDEALLRKLERERAFGKHSTSPRVLSITQPTEVGTVYTLEELERLSSICRSENLLIHMDGSRLYNAAVSLGVELHEIVQAAHLDILSLGGTKNGLLGAEALLIFTPSLWEGSDHLQKQMLQLLSKMRYLSAQYLPFFREGLWRILAQASNEKARAIAALIQATPHLELSYPVETNQIFFTAPASWIAHLQERIWCHHWDRERHEVRCIASWNTSDQDVQDVASVLAEVARSTMTSQPT